MNSRFFKLSATAVSALLFASAVSALEVNEPELKSAGTIDTVVFQNYTGPHSKIDSLSAIKSIGSGMGTVIAANPTKPATAGDRARYYVIHAVDSSVKDKLDADILFVGSNSTVDHIDNLRRILAAYLTAAYGYNEQDAQTVAVFVTVYNAVYRGKLDVYQSKYKDAVTKNLTKDNCGLALSYKDWPGKSQIVIPLFDVNGGISTVDTSVISDKTVVKHMQEDDGKNIDSRKQMVDIKEREAEKATEKAQTAQKKATDEQKKADTQQKKTTAAKQEADTAKKEADTAQKKAAENPNDKQAQKDAEQKTAVAEQKQQAADEQQKKSDEQQATADQAKNDAETAQDVADKKQTEAQEERTEIAKDMQEVIEQAAQEALMPATYGVQLSDESKLLSAMVKMNKVTGETIRESPVTYIRNRTVYPDGDNFIAVAGENSGNGTVKLVTLDKKNMEITAESKETIAENSVLVKDGADYYCVIQDGSSYVLGKFDNTLSCKLKSPVSISASSPVYVSTDGIIVTGTDGTAKLLGLSDLKEITAAQAASQTVSAAASRDAK